VFIGALHGGGDGWVVGQLPSLLGLCAQGSPATGGEGGLGLFGMLLFVPPSVVSGSFGSGDPASPRIYPSNYLVDIARAG
jgi:hypothetical protein